MKLQWDRSERQANGSDRIWQAKGEGHGYLIIFSYANGTYWPQRGALGVAHAYYEDITPKPYDSLRAAKSACQRLEDGEDFLSEPVTTAVIGTPNRTNARINIKPKTRVTMEVDTKRSGEIPISRPWEEFDDEALGKAIKDACTRTVAAPEETRVPLMAATLVLISIAHKCKAEMLGYTVEGVTMHGEPIGDWKATVSKVENEAPDYRELARRLLELTDRASESNYVGDFVGREWSDDWDVIRRAAIEEYGIERQDDGTYK